MKSLIIYSGITLLVLANIGNNSNNSESGAKTLQVTAKKVTVSEESKSDFSRKLNLSDKKGVSNATKLTKSRKLFSGSFPKPVTNEFDGNIVFIDDFSAFKNAKTADELIAEDNAITGNNLSNETQVLDFKLINRDSSDCEIIEYVNPNTREKTTDELIAEDNAITENNLSNETQPLDFEIIDRISLEDEMVEYVNPNKREKTAEELIAEDNAITGNNLSNETQPLDFEIINRNFVTDNDN